MRQFMLTGVLAVATAAAQTSTVSNTQNNCKSCHAKQSQSQPSTAMGQAAIPAIEAQVLKARPAMRFASGGYTYAIDRKDDGVIYSVSDGTNTFSAPIVWALGIGSIGQTYLYEHRGQLYESRISFYPPIGGLDFTIGHARRKVASAEEAAGRLLSNAEMTRCLGCHTTEIANRTIAGIQCEKCHKNTQQHAKTTTASASPSITPARLSRLSSAGLSDFCGGCHRTQQEIVANRVFSINNVRSQPYRLGTSKCFTAAQDKRISCVACHDPHKDMTTDANYYDGKCQACHQTGAVSTPVKTCPVGQKDCVSCHMPKIDFPDGHSRFTDHRIRIVHPGERFPG